MSPFGARKRRMIWFKDERASHPPESYDWLSDKKLIFFSLANCPLPRKILTPMKSLPGDRGIVGT